MYKRQDYPLVSYAKKLCDRLKQAGFSLDLKEYSNTMMLLRVVSGKYDVFLASDDVIDVTTLSQMDYMIMDSEEMRWVQCLSQSSTKRARQFQVVWAL